MARTELRKPADVLAQQRNKIDQEMITIQDQINLQHEQMAKSRQDQFGFKEAIAGLNPQASNNLPRKILRAELDEARGKADGHSKTIDELTKKLEAAQIRKKSIDKAIKELQAV